MHIAYLCDVNAYKNGFSPDIVKDCVYYLVSFLLPYLVCFVYRRLRRRWTSRLSLGNSYRRKRTKPAGTSWKVFSRPDTFDSPKFLSPNRRIYRYILQMNRFWLSFYIIDILYSMVKFFGLPVVYRNAFKPKKKPNTTIMTLLPKTIVLWQLHLIYTYIIIYNIIKCISFWHLRSITHNE